jgi:phosphate transport system permease protein
MATLPTMINEDRSDFALVTAAERMWGAALTLILIVLLLNLIGRAIAHFSSVRK